MDKSARRADRIRDEMDTLATVSGLHPARAYVGANNNDPAA